MTENDVQGVDQEAKDVVDDFTKIASTVNTVIQLLSILYRTLDDTKILEDLGNLYQKAYRAMSKAHTDMDVYAYEEYIGAGMSSRQASELLLARTATSGLKLNTKIWDNTVFGKKKEEK
ncbi:MAG: hypothetical protein IJU37_11870 [Desulfovibrio sp.]|nr:hypothetical protein [Desulfovibrio sp.]